jgi:hypothetical protein
MGAVSDTGGKEEQDPSAERELGRWERWTTDWEGQPIVEFDSEAHQKWLDERAPECRRRVRRALGYRERSIGELELGVALEAAARRASGD